MAQVTLKIKLEDDASQNLMKIRDELNKIDGASKPASSGMARFKDSVVTGAVMGIAQAGVRKLGSAMKNSVSSITSASDALRSYDYSMKFIGLNDKRIEQSKKVLKDYAYSTVYSVKDVLNVSQVLAASGTKNFDAVATSLGNVVALGGGAEQEFKSVAEALGKAGTQGKMTAQNWSSFATNIPASASMIEKELKKMGVYTGDFATAMSSGKIGIKDFNQALVNLGDTDYAKDFAKSSNFFVGASQKIQNSIEELGVDLLEAIDPNVFTGFMNIIGDSIKSFGDVLKTVVEYVVANKDWLLPLIASVGSIIGALVLIGKTVGIVSLAISGITKVVLPLISVFKVLFAVIMANPLAALITGIILVITWLVNLYNTNEEFRNKVNAIFQSIADFFITVWQGIADFFINLWNGITSAFQGIWEGIKIFFIALIEVFKLIITSYFNFYINIFNMLSTVFIAIWDGIKVFFIIIWDVLKNVVITTVNVFGAIFSTIYNIFATPFQTAFNVVRGIFNSLRTIVSSVVSSIAGTFQKVINAIVSPIRTAVNTAKGILNTLSGAINTVVSGVGSAIGNMFVSAVNAIKSTINNYLISPINSAMGILSKLGIKISIPYLATGGIIDGATLAVVGEAGREAVVPMTNKSVMTELANEINKYRGVGNLKNNGSVNNENNNIEYVFNVSTQTFDEKSIRRFLLKEAKGCGY